MIKAFLMFALVRLYSQLSLRLPHFAYGVDDPRINAVGKVGEPKAQSQVKSGYFTKEAVGGRDPKGGTPLIVRGVFRCE